MRRRRPERRKILPDPVYKDLSISKFINYLMSGGKKGVAEKIFYNALDIIKQKTKSKNAHTSVQLSAKKKETTRH